MRIYTYIYTHIDIYTHACARYLHMSKQPHTTAHLLTLVSACIYIHICICACTCVYTCKN